jgi:hypothetical protein
MARTLTVDRILDEDIFSLLGIEGISEERKLQMMRDMSETIEARFYKAVYDALPEAARAQLEHLSPVETALVLEKNGIDADRMLQEEAILYRAEIASLMDLSVNPSSAA